MKECLEEGKERERDRRENIQRVRGDMMMMMMVGVGSDRSH